MAEEKGFSLSEFMVAALIFLLLTTSLMATLSIGQRYWNRTSKTLEGQQITRTSLDSILKEMRQAIANPDPGQMGNQPTGYRQISPSVEPTGILMPNANALISDYCIFTEPNPDFYNPGAPDFNAENPANYQKIRFYVKDNNALYREITRYDSSGAVVENYEDPVAIEKDGTMTLRFEFRSNAQCDVGITIAVGEKTYLLDTRVFLGTN